MERVRRPPQLAPLVASLASRDVAYVVTGSVAALWYGVDLTPGDFDVAPALDQPNLLRLAAVLADLQAEPESFGHWETGDDGERRWVDQECSPEQVAAWKPSPDDLSSFDHLFHTRHGSLDVVPELTGSFELLRPRALERSVHGQRVLVAHVDDLLATLTLPRRQKDIDRVHRLRGIQRSLTCPPSAPS